MGAKMSWTASAKWAAVSGLVFIVLAAFINAAMGVFAEGQIGFYAMGVFVANLFIYRYDLYRMLP